MRMKMKKKKTTHEHNVRVRSRECKPVRELVLLGLEASSTLVVTGSVSHDVKATAEFQVSHGATSKSA